MEKLKRDDTEMQGNLVFDFLMFVEKGGVVQVRGTPLNALEHKAASSQFAATLSYRLTKI